MHGLLRPVIAAGIAGLLGAGCAAPARPRHLVLAVIDALRADHLHCYGYRRKTSPAIDRLAAEGVRFERAYAQASWTRAASASLLTGRYPSSHGCLGRAGVLGDRELTLAELFAPAGFETAGFVANPNFRRRFGLGQGFSTWIELFEGKAMPQLTPATEVNWALREFLDRRAAAGPLLVFVFYLEPHAPYAPPAGLAERFLPRRRQPGERERARARYDGEIVAVDRAFAQLRADLERRGLWADSVVVLTADHGEELGERGAYGHGHSVFEEQLRIPLLIAGPSLPRGIAIGAPVQQVDLLPTLAELFGLEPPPDLAGRSLLPLLAAGAPAGMASREWERPIFVEQTLGAVRFEALIAGPWKWIHNFRRDTDSLFNLDQDPGERSNRIARDPGPARALGRRAEALRRRAEASAREAPREATLDPEERRQLEALGYLQ
ncbi:MAG TPA: sulfatase [Acidobacteriota bacterium]